MNPPEPIDPHRDTILFLNGVSVSFDGFKALNQLAFYVLTGELRAIIGPNGAGKTTMMDVVTGKTRPDSGIVEYYGGIDLTRLDETRIANLGIGRKFQKPTVFESLTVTDNLELAARGSRQIVDTLFRRLGRDQGRRIEETIETILAPPAASRLLGADPTTPMLLLIRSSRDANGQPLEYVRSLYRGDRFRLATRLTRP